MTKYFYTDPLAAAWMAKHFGMKIEWSNEDGWQITHLIHQSIMGNEKVSIVKLYIHPDSLYLLDPQEGDIVNPSSSWQLAYIGSTILVKNMERMPNSTFMDINTINDISKKYGDVIIIQRKGIPFMWPESEE